MRFTDIFKKQHREEKMTNDISSIENMIDEVIQKVVENPILNTGYDACYAAYQGVFRGIENIAIKNNDKNGQYMIASNINSMAGISIESMLGQRWPAIVEAHPDGPKLNENLNIADYARAGAYAAYIICCGEVQDIYDEAVSDKGIEIIKKAWI